MWRWVAFVGLTRVSWPWCGRQCYNLQRGVRLNIVTFSISRQAILAGVIIMTFKTTGSMPRSTLPTRQGWGSTAKVRVLFVAEGAGLCEGEHCFLAMREFPTYEGVDSRQRYSPASHSHLASQRRGLCGDIRCQVLEDPGDGPNVALG